MNHQGFRQLKEKATLLYQYSDIDLALRRIAEKLNVDYRDKNPVFIVVLNGGLIFAGQLLPMVDVLCEIDYCHATRYQGGTRGFELVWKARPQTDLKNRNVILLDDILDEGVTLQLIEEYCIEQQALSVKTVVLVEKLHQRKAVLNQSPDYCELTVPDEYVFGFGMDYSHHWRNTRAIYSLGKQ